MGGPDEVEVDCPLGCGYCGPPQSVEAHISRKTDDAHKGEVGSSFREEMGAEPTSTSIEAETVVEDSSKTLATLGAVGAVLVTLSRVGR